MRNIYYVYVENNDDCYVTKIIEKYFFSMIMSARKKESNLTKRYKETNSNVVFEVVELNED